MRNKEPAVVILAASRCGEAPGSTAHRQRQSAHYGYAEAPEPDLGRFLCTLPSAARYARPPARVAT